LQLLKQIYVAEPREEFMPVRINRAVQAALVALALAVVALGCAPDLLLKKLETRAATVAASNAGNAR
jgi:NADH:ubiquinone oxidoreductase subunit 2 (subunit N)